MVCRLVAALALLLAPSALAWQVAVSDTPPAAAPEAVVADASGDVVAVGRTVAAAGDEDGLVVKLAGQSGTELWRHVVAGSSAADDLVRGVAIAGTDVVVAGQQAETATAGDAFLARYASDGTPLWQTAIDADGANGGEDDAFAVALDGTGQVVAVGQSTPSGATAPRFTVFGRHGADGTEAWTTALPDEPGTARAVLVQGPDVYAAGEAGNRLVVTRLVASTGAVVWRTDVAGSTGADGRARVLAAGGGRVVVAGRLVSPATGWDFAVVALDAATGFEAWRRILDASATEAQDRDDAFGVAVDAAGDVLAVGRLSDAVTDDDLAALKLAGATGSELWRAVVNGNNDNDDVAQALALDPAGDLLIAGTLRSTGTRADLLVMKIDNATGVERWRATFDGTEHAADQGVAVAAAGSDLVGAGRLRNGATGDGFVVVTRTGANGGDFPCANGTPDPGEGCDDGNTTAGDGCRGDCTPELCGDGIGDPQEACDDGNTADGDCCSASCALEIGLCDDGNACTLDETCQAGVCTPTAVVDCPAASPCHTGVCNPADGSCSSVPKPEGGLCDDANACTVLDRCVASVCTGAIPQTCTDGDPCTTDGCEPASGCAFAALTSFPSITCVFERADVGAACTTGLPRPVQAQLDRARRLIDKASTTNRIPRSRRALGKARTALKRAARFVGAQLRREKISEDCANALSALLAEVETRTTAVRDTLVP
jgi:cysteine-rich repeat protein